MSDTHASSPFGGGPSGFGSQEILRASLYDYISITNPLDITGPGVTADPHVHRAALEAMGADPDMSIILYATAGSNGCLDAQGAAGKPLLAAIQKYPHKVWLRMSVVSGNFREQLRKASAGVVEDVKKRVGAEFVNRVLAETSKK